MSLIDDLRTISQQMIDALGYPLSVNFFYGPEDFQALKTDQNSNLNDETTRKVTIYVFPVPSTIPQTANGFLREVYDLRFIVGYPANLDSSELSDERDVWLNRSYAKQFVRRVLAVTNSQDVKTYMSLEDARVNELRRHEAANMYGVLVEWRLTQRIPDETC